MLNYEKIEKWNKTMPICLIKPTPTGNPSIIPCVVRADQPSGSNRFRNRPPD